MAKRRARNVAEAPYCVEVLFYEMLSEVVKYTPELEGIVIGHCRDADADNERESRVFAHVGHKKGVVCVADALGLMPEENIRGVLWHEFGHLADFEGYEGGTGYEEADADVLAWKLWGIEIGYDENDVQYVKE